jgi:hypothetical protein
VFHVLKIARRKSSFGFDHHDGDGCDRNSTSNGFVKTETEGDLRVEARVMRTLARVSQLAANKHRQ